MIFFRDDTPHIYNDTYLNQEKVLEIISDITDLLQEVFPSTKVYSALGNHDWSPKSQLPPRPDPFYARIADKWSNWITETQADDTFKKGTTGNQCSYLMGDLHCGTQIQIPTHCTMLKMFTLHILGLRSLLPISG